MTTEHYELVDKYKIVDAFEPSKVLLVVLDKDMGKKFCDMLNQKLELEKEVSNLREERRELKAKLARLETWKEGKQEQLAAIPRKQRDPSAPRRKPVYKEKKCVDCGHSFIPRSGRSVRCDSCQMQLNAQRSKDPLGRTPVKMHTEIRGTRTTPSSTAVRVPSVEEVLAMPVGPERQKWESRWSPAEVAYATKIKWKIEREQWKKMRNRGFSLDDPIMGTGKGGL